MFMTHPKSERRLRLLEKINKVKFYVESEWRITLVAVTLDASGESAKARRLARQLYPQLLTPDCYGHQVHIVSRLEEY